MPSALAISVAPQCDSLGRLGTTDHGNTPIFRASRSSQRNLRATSAGIVSAAASNSRAIAVRGEGTGCAPRNHPCRCRAGSVFELGIGEFLGRSDQLLNADALAQGVAADERRPRDVPEMARTMSCKSPMERAAGRSGSPWSTSPLRRKSSTAPTPPGRLSWCPTASRPECPPVVLNCGVGSSSSDSCRSSRMPATAESGQLQP
jgi:hypothetical protein